MIDQSHVNLINLLPGQYKFVSQTGGGEYHGACPFCGGKDRFAVWPKGDNGGHWWCRQCGKSGDSLSFLMAYKSLDFKAACQELRCIVPDEPTRQPRQPQPEVYASDLKDYACFDDRWQNDATVFAEDCADRLYRNWRGRAGQYLEGRGITREMAINAFLGVNPANYKATWGSVEVYLPRGITIPWEIDQQLWNVRVRRPNADLVGNPDLPKYASAKGCANGLYRVNQIFPLNTVWMTEGEFDQMVLEHYLHEFYGEDNTVVSIGSNTGARVIRWIARLALASKVVLCFDNDSAGEVAAEYWLKALGRKATWKRPTKKDITEIYQAGELASWMKESA
jgi:DNA primase